MKSKIRTKSEWSDFCFFVKKVRVSLDFLLFFLITEYSKKWFYFFVLWVMKAEANIREYNDQDKNYRRSQVLSNGVQVEFFIQI